MGLAVLEGVKLCDREPVALNDLLLEAVKLMDGELDSLNVVLVEAVKLGVGDSDGHCLNIVSSRIAILHTRLAGLQPLLR